MGSVATRKYKDPPDRGVVCSYRSVVSSDISLWAVWPPENIEAPLIEVFLSDISLLAVWPPENIKTPLIEVLYVVI